jgi:hypothetical protein
VERRHRERAVHEDQPGEGERDEPGVVVPERREPDAECRQDEVHREVLEGEEARVADRQPAREAEHGREQQVVQPGNERRHAVAVECGSVEDRVRRAPRGHRGERVIRDVERLDMERQAALEPARHMLDGAIDATNSGGSRSAAGRRKTPVVWYDVPESWM